jgi:hypothetical protein
MLIEAGFPTGEVVSYDEDSENYLDEFERVRENIKRNCSRFKQYVLSIIDISAL